MENPNEHGFGFSPDNLRQGDFPMGSNALNNMQPYTAGSYPYLQMRQFVGNGHSPYDRQSQGQHHQGRDPGSYGLPAFCSSAYTQGSGLNLSNPYQLHPDSQGMSSMVVQNPRMDDPMMFMQGRQVNSEGFIEDQHQILPSFSSIYASAASNISTMPVTNSLPNQQGHQSSCSPELKEHIPANSAMKIKPIKHELPETSACFALSSKLAQRSTNTNPLTQEAVLTRSAINSVHPTTERLPVCMSPTDINSCSATNLLNVNPLNQTLAEVDKNKNYSDQYCMQDMQVNTAIREMTQQFVQPMSSNVQGLKKNNSCVNNLINLPNIQSSNIENKSPPLQHNHVNTGRPTVSPQNDNLNDTSKQYFPVTGSTESVPTEHVATSCSVSETFPNASCTPNFDPKSSPSVLTRNSGSQKNAVTPQKVCSESVCVKPKRSSFVRFFVMGRMESSRFVSRGTSTETDDNLKIKEDLCIAPKESIVCSSQTGSDQDGKRFLEEHLGKNLSDIPNKDKNKEPKIEINSDSELIESVTETDDSISKSTTEIGSLQETDDTLTSVTSDDIPKAAETSNELLLRSFPENSNLSGISQDNYSFDSSFGSMHDVKSSTPLVRKKRLDIKVHIDDSQCIMEGNQKRWQCNMCEKSYTTKSNLITHILGHRGIKPHICMLCGRTFKQLSHLNTHMLKHDNLRPHVCQICGKGFTQISHLKRHLVVHMDDKPHFCDICKRGFVYPSDLKTHHDRYPEGDCLKKARSSKSHEDLNTTDVEDIRCPECNKAFKYPSQLKDHMPTHSSVRPYICAECGLDFLKEHHLKAHQFTHTGLKPFQCTLCDRAFNQKANLVRHQLIHSAKRDYSCEICDKSFTQPQTLKAHMVVHSEKKPYQCKLCGKGFGRLHNLQGHMHIHENSKPFICFCGCSFSLRGNLNRHKKVKHGLNESTESMEAEAVQLLKSFSERAKDGRKRRRDDNDGPKTYLANKNLTPIGFDDSYDADDTESRSSSLPLEDGGNPSPRKQRKSMPRKAVARESSPEVEDDELTVPEKFNPHVFTKGVLGLEETTITSEVKNNRLQKNLRSNCTSYNLQSNVDSVSD